MAKSDLYTGIDIGTSTIKVLVAEYVNNEINVIGIGTSKSAGVKNGIIVDIPKAAAAIRRAVEVAKQRTQVEIEHVSVSVPSNMLEINDVHAMANLLGENGVVADSDVAEVVQNAVAHVSVVPEREILAIEPGEFSVDGFRGISDPRGMFGTRIEFRGKVYTGPKTIIHNIKNALASAGLKLDSLVVSAVSLPNYVLSESEREFGTVVIDMGAGQTTTIVEKDYRLAYAEPRVEGGEYVTKDISTVLNTSFENAEAAKINYGEASTERASEDEKFYIDVVGKDEPETISELYLAQIIEARISQIFERAKKDIEQQRLGNIAGGIVLVGGASALPGVPDVASKVFNTNVKLFIPNNFGLRNPSYAHVLSVVNSVSGKTDIERLVDSAAQATFVPRPTTRQVMKKVVEETTELPPVVEPTATYMPQADSDEPSMRDKATKAFGSIKEKFGGLFE
jgi:cell division protein FtsA